MSNSKSKTPQAPEQSQENNSLQLENKDLENSKDQIVNNPDPEIPDMDAPIPPKVDLSQIQTNEEDKEKKNNIPSLSQIPQTPEQSQENNSLQLEEQPENTGRSNGAGIFHGNKDVDKKYPLDYDPEDNIVVRVALVASSGGQVSEVPNSASIQVFEPSVYDHLKETGAFKGKAVLILNE